MPLYGDKARELEERLARLGVRAEDLDESFIHSGGKGGQNVNKVATCVVLVHRPTGIAVKCQRERTQGANRLIARSMLADKIEERRLGAASKRQQEAEQVRRQKRRRSRRAKQRMLRDKHAQSDKKARRGPVVRRLTACTTRSRRSTTSGRRGRHDAVRARRGGEAGRRCSTREAAARGRGRARSPRPARRRLRDRDDCSLDVRRGTPAWRLAGVDGSAGMLAAARAQTGGRDGVTWARAQLTRRCRSPPAFDVCTVFYDTLNHLPDAQALARTFAAARDRAAPGWPAGLRRHQPSRVRGVVGEPANRFSGAGWSLLVDARYDAGSALATRTSDAGAGRHHAAVRHPPALLRPRGGRGAGWPAPASGSRPTKLGRPFPIGGLGKSLVDGPAA